MLKAYRYRIYPNEQQQVLLQKHFGCVRYIYNMSLEYKVQLYEKEKKNVSWQTLCSTFLLEEKKKNKWLEEVTAQSLQQAIINLDSAFTAFFRKQNGFPKFKKKNVSKKSVSFPQNVRVNFKENTIKFPKLKKIKTVMNNKFKGQIKECTIVQKTSGKYFANILVEDSKELPKKRKVKESTTLGIDLGLTHFYTDSNGNKIENNRFLDKSLKKIKVLQQRHQKKTKGGKNREKARIKLAKAYEKTTNQKNNFLHKLTYNLTHESQVNTICIEDLNVKGMVQNHRLARAISQVGWSEFNRQLEYKCEWYGKNLIKIGRFEPSSKMCSKCGTIKKDLGFEKTWSCSTCLSNHDRDVNAAVNIKNFGLLTYQRLMNKPGPQRSVEPVEISVLKTESTKQEVSKETVDLER